MKARSLLPVTNMFVRYPAALLAAALLPLALSACGDKGSETKIEKIAAGENVPPPEGKQWSDVVSATPELGFVMGNPDAPAKLVEFGSYTCSHCRDFTAEASEPLRKMVDTGRLSYEFRSFLRDPFDISMSLITRCGGPEPFFPLTEQMFGNQNAFFEKAQSLDQKAIEAAGNQPLDKRFITLAEMAGLIDFAKQRGISEDKVRQCLADAKTSEALVESVQKASQQYDITGTPTFLLNGSVVKDVATWQLLRPKLQEAGL